MTQEAPANLNISSDSLSTDSKPWWQLLLMSPVLVALIASGIPSISNLITAFKAGVSPEKAPLARQQENLWEKNAHCLVSGKHSQITTSEKVRIDVLTCPSGDILLTRALDSQEPQRQWIAFATASNTAFTDILMPRANAATSTTATLTKVNQTVPSTQLAQAGTVICTKILGEGRLLQRLRNSNGQCVDEVINTFTGDLVSRTPGSCSSNCEQ
ncbi:MAG: hypothetical protein KME42_00760 [Tildeniella nuda ZEHNDER 1965/U140]|jgi:ABC-type transport system involved in multi-copper enzyme maturation permease subunit|nr:hypothetical protein [Tildeniella nuda ZEHNDER 1965/U140]